MDLWELIQLVARAVAILVALIDLWTYLVSLGSIAMDCFTHFLWQSSTGSLGWLLMLWITYWSLPSTRHLPEIQAKRVASYTFRFLFWFGLSLSFTAHVLQDWWPL